MFDCLALTDYYFQLIANYCIAKIIGLPNRTLLPLLPIRKVIADSFQSNSHWIAMGSKDPFLHCKHNYAEAKIQPLIGVGAMRSLILQMMLYIPGQQFLKIKKASYLSHKLVARHAPFLIFSNHPNITILLFFLLQHKGSLHIFLWLYFCVFIFLCFCV